MVDETDTGAKRSENVGVDVDVIVGDVVKSLLAAGLMVLAAAPFIVGIIVVANGWVEFYVPVCLLIVAAAIVIAGERIARSLRARR